MNKYTLGSTYRVGHIDTASEIVPQNAAFRSFPGETHVFEERVAPVSFYQITTALENGVLTPLDKTVISLVAVFGSAACTTKSLHELLTLMGLDVNRNVLESCVKRLHKYHLINFSRFRMPDGKQSNTRIITLMKYGSQVARSLGIAHYFNPIAVATAQAPAVKSRTETVQLICNWLKNLPVEKFAVRPTVVVDASIGAIVRPAATIDIAGDTLYFEVPRRHEDWLEDLIEKLHRYELVFGKDKMPSIVINGEDAEMNLEIFNALKNESIDAEIMYTDDLAMFGSSFRSCLYRFDGNNNILRFHMNDTESEAV